MRRWGAWRFKAALLVGLGAAVPVLAVDPPDDAAPATGWHMAPWLQRRMPPPPPKPVKKAAPKPSKDSAAKAAPKPAAPVVDETALERDREEKAFLRRLAVCDALRKIAQENRDEELERKAQQLHERAWALYQQRIAHLPCSGAHFDSDEATLTKHVGAGTAPAGRAAGAALSSAPEDERGPSAALREVRP